MMFVRMIGLRISCFRLNLFCVYDLLFLLTVFLSGYFCLFLLLKDSVIPVKK